MSEMPIKDIVFRENRSPRLLCVRVQDLSSSMLEPASPCGESKIDLLNKGRRKFAEALKADEQAARTVQILEVGFGRQSEVWTESGPCDAATFDPKPFTANGTTPLGAAVPYALNCNKQITDGYRDHAILHYRSWVWIESDGQPTDDWKPAAEATRDAEARGDVIVIPVGIGANADFEVLAAFSRERPPLRIEAVHYPELFLWVSRSLAMASRSRPGEAIDLGFGKPVRT